jgi:O-antigen/teichoic acid export membrane protein
MASELIPAISLWRRLRRFQSDSLFTNSTFFLLSTIAATGLGAMYWWIAARFCATTVVGSTVVLISTSQLITTAALLGLGFSMVHFLPTTENQSELINVALSFSFLAALALSIMTLWIGPRVFPALSLLGTDTQKSLIFVFFTTTLAAFQVVSPVLAAIRAGRLLLYVNLGIGIGRIVLILALPLTSVPALMSVFVGPMIIVLIVLWGLVLPKLVPGFSFRPTLNLRRWSHIFSYSIPSYAANLLHDLPYQVLPLIVAGQLGAASAAYFFMAWNVFGLLTTVGGSISLSLFVEGSHDARSLRRLTKKAATLTLGMTTLLAFIVVVLAFPILAVFGKNYATHGASLLQILAAASIPAAMVYIGVAVQRVEIHLDVVMLAFAVIAIITFALVATNTNELIGIGLAWSAAQLVAAGYLVLAYRKDKHETLQ